MTHAEVVAQKIARGWKQIAATPVGRKKVEKVVARIEQHGDAPHYVQAVRIYRAEGGR